MSDELPGIAGKLREAINGAIQSSEQMPLCFLAVAVYENADGVQSWSWATAEGQTPVTSMGLVQLIGRTVDHDVHETYFPQEGD